MDRRLLPAILALSLAGTGAAQINLTPNTPRFITFPQALPVSTDFTFQPVAGNFNAIGAVSNCNQRLALGSVVSDQTFSATEFLLTFQSAASGTQFPQTTLQPTFPLPFIPDETVEHVTGLPVSLNSHVNTVVGAGHVLKLLSLATNFTGAHDLIVTGDPSLKWAFFTAGTSGVWRRRVDALATGVAGGPPVVLNLSPINHALVVFRENDTPFTDVPFSARLAPTTTHIALPGPGTSIANLSNASYQFTMTPQSFRWSAIGIAGSVGNVNTISIGSATSGAGSNPTAYVVANGHQGAISPVDGLLTHSSSLGLTGTLHQAGNTAMAVGTPGSKSWATSDFIHIFEFSVFTPHHYDVGVTGANALGWQLFEPGSNASWRPRTQNIASAFVGTARNIFLAPGSYAVVVSKAFAGASTGTVVCSVALSNPVPVITSMTPDSVPAGSPSGTVLINGTGITTTTTAAWDGIPLSIVSSTATQLVASVPASLVAAPGVHAVTMTNPAPAGGTSAPAVFTVAAPTITAASPASIAPIPPGGLPVAITVDGAGFLPGAVVHAGAATLPTTFVSANQLTALVGPSVPDAVFAGGLALTVENGRLAQSNTVSVQVAPGGNNRGTIVRAPLDPLPNESYVARLEGGVPGQAFSCLADLVYSNPVVHWPDMSGDMVLRITSSSVIPLYDGIGLLGPAWSGGVYTSNPSGTAPGGVFTIPGFVWPAAPINFRLTLQTVHFDPAAAYGFNLSWPRTEDL